jgi:hypothetical protein
MHLRHRRQLAGAEPVNVDREASSPPQPAGIRTIGTAIAEDGLLGISEAQIETGRRRDRTFRARRRIILRPSAA